ncbi:hypothetical protein ACTJJ7_20140 [Phyllobacterium sp. 22229]|uniref:hypothetical protein n=1 Tax=Phyllobacterium sp. 22229 TaxID=3453895 RepID=UPI003F8565E5
MDDETKREIAALKESVMRIAVCTVEMNGIMTSLVYGASFQTGNDLADRARKDLSNLQIMTNELVQSLSALHYGGHFD